MKNLFNRKAGNITVYNYDGKTREYISTSNEYLAIGRLKDEELAQYNLWLDEPGIHKAELVDLQCAMDLNGNMCQTSSGQMTSGAVLVSVAVTASM